MIQITIKFELDSVLTLKVSNITVIWNWLHFLGVISINTLAYEGYDLSTALQEIAKIGVSHVELGYTQGWTEGLTEEHFSEASAADINRLLSDLGLSSIALSAHIDLTTEAAVDELKRRIDFGKRLGAKIVNTKVGARSGLKKFEKNIL